MGKKNKTGGGWQKTVWRTGGNVRGATGRVRGEKEFKTSGSGEGGLEPRVGTESDRVKTGG